MSDELDAVIANIKSTHLPIEGLGCSMCYLQSLDYPCLLLRLVQRIEELEDERDRLDDRIVELLEQ